MIDDVKDATDLYLSELFFPKWSNYRKKSKFHVEFTLKSFNLKKSPKIH